MDNEKKRKELGIVIPVTKKNSPSSYDIKGSVKIDGKVYRVGGYMAEASGQGKMAAGQKYYYWHRVEPMEDMPAQQSASNDPTSFDPMELEK